jgi:hypothetical protein
LANVSLTPDVTSDGLPPSTGEGIATTPLPAPVPEPGSWVAFLAVMGVLVRNQAVRRRS